MAVRWLPLPPTSPSHDPGACTPDVNPRHTGCMSGGRDGLAGIRSFAWDGRHVLLGMRYTGAPADPANPAHIYNGTQLVLIKSQPDEVFANGDAWKCLTCGMPPAQRQGANLDDLHYPEAFRDGSRVKMGANVFDCAPHALADEACTPAVAHVYPIHSPFPPFPKGGLMREERLHPDNVHLGWNQLFLGVGGSVSEVGVFGRLIFEPKASPPAYTLTNVTFLVNADTGAGLFFRVEQKPTPEEPGRLRFLGDGGKQPPVGIIGEFRGFSSDGRAALGIGTWDAFNFDAALTDMTTGASKRLSIDPAYTDPISMSPDDSSFVLMDGRSDSRTGEPDGYPAGQSGRMYFASAGPGVPPLLDLALSSAVSNVYNLQYGDPGPDHPAVAPDDQSGGRRFFQPYLFNVDAPRDPGELHDGQWLNAGGDPKPGSGSISDPLWNGGADPAWSPNGTAIVYDQLLVGPPACNSGDTSGNAGGPPPEPRCPTSSEPGGRFTRVMLAELLDRKGKPTPPQLAPAPDAVPWGIPYREGDKLPPPLPSLPGGNFTLAGRVTAMRRWRWRLSRRLLATGRRSVSRSSIKSTATTATTLWTARRRAFLAPCPHLTLGTPTSRLAVRTQGPGTRASPGALSLSVRACRSRQRSAAA